MLFQNVILYIVNQRKLHVICHHHPYETRSVVNALIHRAIFAYYAKNSAYSTESSGAESSKLWVWKLRNLMNLFNLLYITTRLIKTACLCFEIKVFLHYVSQMTYRSRRAFGSIRGQCLQIIHNNLAFSLPPKNYTNSLLSKSDYSISWSNVKKNEWCLRSSYSIKSAVPECQLETGHRLNSGDDSSNSLRVSLLVWFTS